MEEMNLIDQLNASFLEQNNGQANTFWREMNQPASFRPTIFIGIGGFGCGTVRELKKSVESLIPDENIRRGFGFIGIDTHHAERGDILATNYLGITNITPHIVASQPQNKRFLDWYNKLPKGNWKARNIAGGANQVRAVGRLAFLYPPTLEGFYNILNNTFNEVNQFRENFQTAASPKVYIISTLAGGTGAGMYLDVCILVNKFLQNVALDASVQSIVVTADTLEGEVPATNLPDLYTNTYASLKDLYALASGESINVAYNLAGFENDFVADMTHAPNPVFLITGKNKDGRNVFSRLDELKFLAVSYLLFEIYTPLEAGGTKVQDQENNNVGVIGNGGMSRVFSSFGAVRFGIPSQEIKEYFSQITLLRALEEELRPDISQADVDSFINDQKLGEFGSDQLQEQLRKNSSNQNITVAFEIMAELQGVKTADLVRHCKRILDEKNQILKEKYSEPIKKNAKSLESNATNGLSESLIGIARSRSLASAFDFINALQLSINNHQQSLTEELSIGKTQLVEARKKCQQSLDDIGKAVQGGFYGRKARIAYSISNFEVDLEAELNQQIVVWSMEEGLKIYDALKSQLTDSKNTWEKAQARAKARKDFVISSSHELMRKIANMADINKRGKGNRFSILNIDQINKVYKDEIGYDREKDMANHIRNQWKENNALMDMVTMNETWYNNQISGLLGIQDNNLRNVNLISVLKKFYSDESAKNKLFENLMKLGSPLFPLDMHFMEPAYSESWVLAVHPAIRNEFVNILTNYLPAGAGQSIAIFPTTDEAIIYSLKFGLTPHSLSRMNFYYGHYSRNMKDFKSRNVENSRPFVARLESEHWKELIPVSKEEEDIRKWFAIGRALSHLYPTKVKSNGEPDIDKNESFIYSRGSHYYLNMTSQFRLQKIKLGNGLRAAITEFGENPGYKDHLQDLAQKLIQEKGISEVRERLLKIYLPLLDAELEKAQNSNDSERFEEMENLRAAILQFINNELAVSAI